MNELELREEWIKLEENFSVLIEQSLKCSKKLENENYEVDRPLVISQVQLHSLWVFKLTSSIFTIATDISSEIN